MTIDPQSIKLMLELILAIVAVGGLIVGLVRWIDKQNRQDEDIKHIKKENSLLVSGLFACLDGLEQLGANHTVPSTKARLEEYINEQAHDLHEGDKK